MNVSIVGWSGTSEPGGGRDARAYVSGVQVSVRRTLTGVRWHCAQCGDSLNTPDCAHQRALAATPAAPEKRNRA